MNRSYLELVAASEDEIRHADRLATKHGCRMMYVPQEMSDLACMARSFSKGRYKIYSMVDYPKGSNFGVNKFKHAGVSSFIVDGYDIILNPESPGDNAANEICDIHSFIRRMIDEHVDICYTISCAARTDEDISHIACTLKDIAATKIKLEAQTSLQPTKANIDTHQHHIDLIREHTATIITICGNVDYNTCDMFMPIYKVALSPQQMEKVLEDEELVINAIDDLAGDLGEKA